MKKAVKTISIVVLLALILTLTPTKTLAQQECETDVVVQADDWLSKIAEKFFGNVLAYQVIADATNVKAATDSSYTTIKNADLIESGWKLCIPSTAEAEAAMVEKLAVKGTSIVIVIPEDPPSFNGAVTDTGYEQMVMELVLLGLTDLDPKGNVLTEMAAELPTLENGGVILDEDAWTMDVTWKIRDDIYWADGEPVTADDVVFTWEAMSNPETGIWTYGSDYVDSIEKIDDYSLIVHYNTVYPGYMTQFGNENVAIWPEHYCDAEQGFVSWDCNREPLSNGPYLLQEWDPGDHLTFVRNPDYYEAGKPYTDKIIVKIVPEEAVMRQMMIEGDADVYMWLNETGIQELQSVPNVGISFSPITRWAMRLVPNLAAKGSIDGEADPHPFLSDVRVRQAMRMAIDVDTIAKEIFLGYSDPIWTEMFRPPFNSCGIPKPEYDPEGAKALLEEAGWTDEDGDGIRECHGCTTGAEEGYPMSMEFMIYAEYGELLELSQQLIAEQLKEIGMGTELGMVEGGIMWADYGSGGTEQNGEFELDLWDDGYFGFDIQDYLWSFYYSEAVEPDWGWNVGRWYNKDFDALLDEAYTLDEEYNTEMLCEAARILDQELPHIILWSAIDAAGYSTRTEGVQATINDVITWNAADWRVVE